MLQRELTLLLAASTWMSNAASADAGTCPGQDVADQQAVVAYNSLTDGQPGPPRTIQLTVLPSYDFGEDEFQNQVSLSRVFATSGFWCQAQFSLSAPTLDVGEGLADFEKSVTLAWQQRWRIDDSSGPTISTVVSVQQPYDEPEQETDVTLTGIVARSRPWGALYLNLYAETSRGAGADDLELGGVVGVKRILRDNLSVFADAVVEERGDYALELALELDLANGWTFGPGISLSHSEGSGGLDASLGVNVYRDHILPTGGN